MTDDALKAGHIVDFSSDMLLNFASKNLAGFLDDFEHNDALKTLAMFADGPSGTPGPSPSGEYNELLTANNQKGFLNSAKDLQQKFKAFAALTNTSVHDLKQTCAQFQVDLQAANTVITDADHQAKLTADDMQLLISNLNPTGSPTTTPPPS